MMRHFPHHIGDYAAATAHLSFIEDAAYHRLLRRYYQTEQPLAIDVAEVQRVIGARRREEKAAVEVVLREFFVLENDGWHQKRADVEIEKYSLLTQRSRESGRKGGRPRSADVINKNNGLENPEVISGKPSGKPTKNQEPIPITQVSKSLAPCAQVDSEVLDGVDREQGIQPEGNPERTRKAGGSGTRLPPDWKVTAEQLAYAADQGCADPQRTALNFSQHFWAKAGADARSVNWDLRFMGWCRREQEFKKPNGRAGHGGESYSDRRAREAAEIIERASREAMT